MSQFAVVRHTETGGVGTTAASAMDLMRANGWVRVSEYRAEPAEFHLPDFADAPDLDATAEASTETEPTTAPKAKPAKTTRES